MIYTMLTNANLKEVSSAMIEMVSTFDKMEAQGNIRLNTGERCAVIAGLFYAMMEGRMGKKATPAHMMEVMNGMRHDAIRTRVPEFGGAIRYVQGEL
jgi:hypothetical protein